MSAAVLTFCYIHPVNNPADQVPPQKPAGSGILFINSASEVLLALRDDKPNIPFPNCWDIPGGHIEPGETAEQCVIREMQEEIGHTIRQPTLFRVYEFPDHRDHIFWARADFDLSDVKLNEGQRLKWFSYDEIKATHETSVAFGFKSVIVDFLREAPWLSGSPAQKSPQPAE